MIPDLTTIGTSISAPCAARAGLETARHSLTALGGATLDSRRFSRSSVAQSEQDVLSRSGAKSVMNLQGFRNGARRAAPAPKPLILAVFGHLSDMRDHEKMRVA